MSTQQAPSNNGPFRLSEMPIHLGATQGQSQAAVPVGGFNYDGASYERYVSEYCPAGEGRLLIVEYTPTDWGFWECHTEGDEVVMILEGKAEFIQEIEGVEQRISVAAGDTIINPAGIWHTADVEEPLTAAYITPCANTQHRAR